MSLYTVSIIFEVNSLFDRLFCDEFVIFRLKAFNNVFIWLETVVLVMVVPVAGRARLGRPPLFTHLLPVLVSLLESFLPNLPFFLVNSC